MVQTYFMVINMAIYFENKNPFWFNLKMFGSFAYVPISIIFYKIEPNVGRYLLFFLPVPIFIVIKRFYEIRGYIDVQLNKFIPDIRGIEFFTLKYPGYRFADIHRAVQEIIKPYKILREIKSSHSEDLNSIINNQFYSESDRRYQPSNNTVVKTSPKTEEFIAIDTFWILSINNSINSYARHNAVLRLKFNDNSNEVTIELAAKNKDFAKNFKSDIDKIAVKNSIYKNQLINIEFQQEIRNEYGEIDSKPQMHINFIDTESIDKSQIVITERIEEVLKRNLFDFFQYSKILKSNNIPTYRGLIFFGPPGTGKTFTCKYVFSQLKNVSAIIATGQNLLHVKSICNLAKMLQPCMVVLEDVDLVFSSRETNLYSSVLGDLMDQLDGFSKKENILFILTTNNLERLEKAIKDRPGRISQCIHFELPNTELRLRYLKRELQKMDTSLLDFEKLNNSLDGASQAFISELTNLASQINLENNNYKQKEIRLTNKDFEIALRAMVKDNNQISHSIIGYKSAIL